jgi:hypothetical protein
MSTAVSATINKDYPLHAKVLAIAEGEYAKRVREIPSGSNNGPDVNKYQHATWLKVPAPGAMGWPWCVAFWQWCTAQAGLNMPWKSAGAYDVLAWAQKNGFATTHPIPGDAVVFNIGKGHLSIFDRIEGDTVHTVDGNWGDRVTPVAHKLSEVRGYVHVPEQPVSIVVKKPTFEVVTSASGTAQVVYVSGVNSIAKKLPGLMKRFTQITIRRRK